MSNLFGEKAPNYRHGGYSVNRPEYNSWRAMKSRCLDKNYRRYDLYGGRGIAICDRWLGRDGFKNFLADMGKKPSPKHSIDRIDSNSNYKPSNCRWSTQKQQMNNMSRNKLFTVRGVTDTASNHAMKYGINVHTVFSRMNLGWGIDQAFTTPTKGVGANQTTYGG